MNDGKRIAAATLGCKVNLYDTQAMLELFVNDGYTCVDFDDEADVYLINTCTVTNIGDKKSRQMIRKAKRRNPGAVVVAAGCYAEVKPDEVASLQGVDIVTGTNERSRVLELVNACKSGGSGNKRSVIPPKTSEFEDLSINRIRGRTRAYVKIQDGCDRFCSYCVVPYARGTPRSRGVRSCIDECERLAENGVKEIVLSGIHIASYGNDLKEGSLAEVVSAVQDIRGIERIRFSSVDPLLISGDFLSLIKGCAKVCSHLHLSLQSGCDRTLLSMNRRYDTAFYKDAVSKIRAVYPDAGITTDIIAGFPGETTEDFESSMEFCAEIGFSKIHVFPFSAKEGTRAYDMPFQVPQGEKERRAALFSALSEKSRNKFLEANAGKEMPVLFEQKSGAYFIGYTPNYIRVRSNEACLAENEVKNVVLSKEHIS